MEKAAAQRPAVGRDVGQRLWHYSFSPVGWMTPAAGSWTSEPPKQGQAGRRAPCAYLGVHDSTSLPHSSGDGAWAMAPTVQSLGPTPP